jgi:sulfur-oxidizing protein SoxY
LGGAAGVAVASLPLALLAQDAGEGWEQAVRKVLGDAKPIEGKVLIDLPEIAENGNTVPFTVSVDSPMSETDYVKTVHIIATANPQPGVATFRFSPLSGKANVASRMRLAKTQDVIVIAELGDGRFLMSKRNVKVTIGGCGG